MILRRALLLLLFVGSTVNAAEAPYLDNYPLPGGISGWSAMDVCAKYGVATTMAMFMKRDGKKPGEASYAILEYIVPTDEHERADMDTIFDIVLVVYENKLPAVDSFTVERKVKGRCLRSNGFKE